MEFKFNNNFKVENFILDTKWENLPKNIQDRAIVCSIDLMIALLLGTRGGQFKIGVNTAQKYYKSGNIIVLGTKEKMGILGAVVALSHASNSFDIDDGHNLIKGHPGTSFIAGVLAAAIDKNITYKEYLTTLVICYETTIRMALALQNHYGYLHSTGAYGAYGTAVGMGRILRLSKKMLNNALSVAEFHAPMTPVMRSVQYPSMNKDGVPFGALIGAEAVLETLEGTTGYGNLLELPEYKYLVDSLGKSFEIMNLYFKPFTCCRWAHQPIKACIDLKEAYNFNFKDIEKVIVHSFDSAVQLSKKKPKTTDEAQYNIAWPVAASLVYGDVGFTQVWDRALDDANVLEMMDKLSFVVDPELDCQFPNKRLAWVEIELNDKRVLKSKIYEAPGEHTDHIDLNWIIQKFYKRTDSILEKQQQEDVIKLLTSDLNSNIKSIIENINGCLY